MMSSDNRVEVNILGCQFYIIADENPEYINKIVNLFNDKVKETQGSVGVDEPLKASILTGILIADELYKEQEKNSSIYSQNKVLKDDINKVNRFTKVLNKVLDKTIID